MWLLDPPCLSASRFLNAANFKGCFVWVVSVTYVIQLLCTQLNSRRYWVMNFARIQVLVNWQICWLVKRLVVTNSLGANSWNLAKMITAYSKCCGYCSSCCVHTISCLKCLNFRSNFVLLVACCLVARYVMLHWGTRILLESKKDPKFFAPQGQLLIGLCQK